MSENKGYAFNWLSTHLASPAQVRLYAQDSCMLSATEAVVRAMEDAHISRVELADRIGKSKSFVSQVLSGSRNMTLKTLADLLWACGAELGELHVVPLGAMSVSGALMDAWLDDESARQVNEVHEVSVSGDKRFLMNVPFENELTEKAA